MTARELCTVTDGACNGCGLRFDYTGTGDEPAPFCPRCGDLDNICDYDPRCEESNIIQ